MLFKCYMLETNNEEAIMEKKNKSKEKNKTNKRSRIRSKVTLRVLKIYQLLNKRYQQRKGIE